MLRQAGLDENDIYDITHPQAGPENQNSAQLPGGSVDSAQWQAASGANEKAQPSLPQGNKKPETPIENSELEPIVIPAFPDENTRIDYDLTYYVNDVNLANTQVLMEYGRRNELKNVYTYGNQRLDATRVDGSVDTYEYDGRGSVANLVSPNAEVLASYSYDPFGEMAAGKPEQDVIFGYNSEEYNPLTGLVYLRARYYNVETGTFTTEDSYLGDDDNISSQNRYAYGEGDPVNHIDPTGHFTSLITQQAGW